MYVYSVVCLKERLSGGVTIGLTSLRGRFSLVDIAVEGQLRQQCY